MKRRQFITLAGAIASWPLVGRAQQAGKVRRIGVFVPGSAQTHGQYVTAFRNALAALGYVEGNNYVLLIRWGEGNFDRFADYASELVRAGPEVILTTGIGKWLGFLKEVAPNLARAALLFNPQTTSAAGVYFLKIFDAAASSLGVHPIAAPYHNAVEIEDAIHVLGKEPGGGFVVVPEGATLVNLNVFLASAARYSLPAVYPFREFARSGGLLSYGADVTQQYSRAASYIDRILKGEKPEDLPVQAPTKFELVINLKTAKALGLTVSENLVVAADEVIE